MRVPDLRDAGGTGLALPRVEAGCEADLCMTMLARVTEGAIVPELTLSAGRMVLFGDTASHLWGAPATPAITFEGSGYSGIAAVRRGGAWVLQACSSCFPRFETVPRQPTPVPPRSLPTSSYETIDDLNRALGLTSRDVR